MMIRFKTTILLSLLIISTITMGSGMIASLSMAIIAPLAAILIQMAVSRSREYLMDTVQP